MLDFYDTDDDSDGSVGVKVVAALSSFLAGAGLEQVKQRMADQFRMDAPSKSGKSKSEIEAIPEGVMLPGVLWRVDEGRPITDPSGVQLPSVSKGTGFIDEVLDNDITIWIEIITEWGRTRSDIIDITSE